MTQGFPLSQQYPSGWLLGFGRIKSRHTVDAHCISLSRENSLILCCGSWDPGWVVYHQLPEFAKSNVRTMSDLWELNGAKVNN